MGRIVHGSSGVVFDGTGKVDWSRIKNVPNFDTDAPIIGIAGNSSGVHHTPSQATLSGTLVDKIYYLRISYNNCNCICNCYTNCDCAKGP